MYVYVCRYAILYTCTILYCCNFIVCGNCLLMLMMQFSKYVSARVNNKLYFDFWLDDICYKKAELLMVERTFVNLYLPNINYN